MGSHVYVAVNERFGKFDCRTCGGTEDNPVHKSLTEQILADAKPSARPTGTVLSERLSPDVRSRMEAVIARQGAVRVVEQPHSRAEASAEDIVDTMAKLAPVFGVRRPRWAELDQYERALWIATVREATV